MCAPFFVVIPFQLDAPEGDALDMLDHTPAPTLRTKQKSRRVHAPHVPAMPRLRPGGKVLPSRGTR